MVEPFVILNDVRKEIKKQVIINGFTLQLQRGQIVALCGGNGAGKSTILRMVAGIHQPTSGQIKVGGKSRWQQPLQFADQIGYMPDHFQFSTPMTAFEALNFWAKLKGVSTERTRQLLRDVGLADTGKKSVTLFSKGMKQRLLLAQAMLTEPPLLIMDEPTNGLDPYWLERFVEMIQHAAERGQTVLYATHQLDIAKRVSQRIVFLRNGCVVRDEMNGHFSSFMEDTYG